MSRETKLMRKAHYFLVSRDEKRFSRDGIRVSRGGNRVSRDETLISREGVKLPLSGTV